jgi:xylan 1,4-beta-xylosidase
MNAKRSTITIVLLLALGLTSTFSAPPTAPRTYSNPLLPDIRMADPHVIKSGGSYYLYATTHTRGYDVFVSNDLVNWTNRGSAFTDPRGGCWAPDVYFHKQDGKFYLYYTVDADPKNRGGRNKIVGVAMAQTPLGPFVDQAELARFAIDAHMFQDADRKLYLYYTDLEDGFKIMVQEMANPIEARGDRSIVLQPTETWEKQGGFPVTEGPFMLKRSGSYYLMYSGSPADSPDYAIGYATASSPTGPFTKHSGNPIAAQGGKVIGPGHHAVVEGPDGKLWMFYHQKWDARKNYNRFLALDPIAFDAEGNLVTTLSRDERQPAPRSKFSIPSPNSRGRR